VSTDGGGTSPLWIRRGGQPVHGTAEIVLALDLPFGVRGASGGRLIAPWWNHQAGFGGLPFGHLRTVSVGASALEVLTRQWAAHREAPSNSRGTNGARASVPNKKYRPRGTRSGMRDLANRRRALRKESGRKVMR